MKCKVLHIYYKVKNAWDFYIDILTEIEKCSFKIKWRCNFVQRKFEGAIWRQGYTSIAFKNDYT